MYTTACLWLFLYILCDQNLYDILHHQRERLRLLGKASLFCSWVTMAIDDGKGLILKFVFVYFYDRFQIRLMAFHLSWKADNWMAKKTNLNKPSKWTESEECLTAPRNKNTLEKGEQNCGYTSGKLINVLLQLKAGKLKKAVSREVTGKQWRRSKQKLKASEA